jgi:hypothetical protein
MKDWRVQDFGVAVTAIAVEKPVVRAMVARDDAATTAVSQLGVLRVAPLLLFGSSISTVSTPEAGLIVDEEGVVVRLLEVTARNGSPAVRDVAPGAHLVNGTSAVLTSCLLSGL